MADGGMPTTPPTRPPGAADASGNVPDGQVIHVHVNRPHSSWQSPGFVAIIAVLCLVLGFVIGARDSDTLNGTPSDQLALTGGATSSHDDGHTHDSTADTAHLHDDTSVADTHDHTTDVTASSHSHDSAVVDDSSHVHDETSSTDHTHTDDTVHDHGPTCSLDGYWEAAVAFTPTECLDAQRIIADTKSALAKYADYNAAIADGYQSIEDDKITGWGYVHLVNWSYMFDDSIIMDPTKVESLVYRKGAGGVMTLESAMYILPLGQTDADIPAKYNNAITTWHVHTNLCWDLNTLTVVGLLDGFGNCNPSGTFWPTPPMLHVWLVPTACGPFAEVEGALGDCTHHSH